MQGCKFAELTGALERRSIGRILAVYALQQAVPIARALREQYFKECGTFNWSFARDLKTICTDVDLYHLP